MKKNKPSLRRKIRFFDFVFDVILSVLFGSTTWLLMHAKQLKIMLAWLDKYRPPNWPGGAGMEELLMVMYQSISFFDLITYIGFLSFFYLFFSSIFAKKRGTV